jgi:hypothetical protein
MVLADIVILTVRPWTAAPLFYSDLIVYTKIIEIEYLQLNDLVYLHQKCDKCLATNE